MIFFILLVLVFPLFELNDQRQLLIERGKIENMSCLNLFLSANLCTSTIAGLSVHYQLHSIRLWTLYSTNSVCDFTFACRLLNLHSGLDAFGKYDGRCYGMLPSRCFYSWQCAVKECLLHVLSAHMSERTA